MVSVALNAGLVLGILHMVCPFLQVVKGLRGGVQDVALKMLIGETHYQVNSFRQVHHVPGRLLSNTMPDKLIMLAHCLHSSGLSVF